MSDREIERVVRENPSEREIRDAAKAQGILTMKQDGVLKVLRGVSTFAELERVVDIALDYDTIDENRKNILEAENYAKAAQEESTLSQIGTQQETQNTLETLPNLQDEQLSSNTENVL